MSNLSVSTREWVANRTWQLRQLISDAWGESAAGHVSSAISSYIESEQQAERMRVEITNLRARLRVYEPEVVVKVDPGPTWTGD
jgi:transcriptional accessory protein Tex/SPT6